jgi:hypothetical protein
LASELICRRELDTFWLFLKKKQVALWEFNFFIPLITINGVPWAKQSARHWALVGIVTL